MEITERERDDLVGAQREEVKHGERFEFGKNWSKFLEGLNEKQILSAEESLRRMLEVPDLEGKTFLDVGSGSGLLAWRRIDWARRSIRLITTLNR